MTSNRLVVRELQLEDEASFLRGFDDWVGQDPDWYTFIWRPGMSYAEHLSKLQQLQSAEQLEEGRVPSTMLYAFVGNEIVGRISIRHYLNDRLRQRGGHIGYAVNPSHRRCGFGTLILQQGLIFCRNLGLEEVWISCADSNVPSRKVIESCGGSFERRAFDTEEQEWFRVYLVDLRRAPGNLANVAKKAIAYITRKVGDREELLVFDHDKEYAEAGTQVVCGTVDPDEAPEQTVMREIEEESGLTKVIFKEKIDEFLFFGSHAGAYPDFDILGP